MIESKNMEDFVQQQIRAAVDHYVASVVDDRNWAQDIEQRIIQHVQDRITARFANIATVPDLIHTVQTSVRQLLEQGHVPGIGQYVDQSLMRQAIDQAVEQEIQKCLDLLMLDPAWIEKIENLILQDYLRRLGEWISTIDIQALVVSQIDASVDRWQDRFKQDFSTRGIQDGATELELCLAPGKVSIVHTLSVEDLEVQNSARVDGVLEVNNLVLRGAINTDNQSWNELSNKIAADTLALITDQWRQDLVNEVLDHAKTKGIEFQDVLIKGLPLVKEGALNPAIRHSRLETLGTLERLAVAGNSDLCDTMHVVHRRVGINTADPEMTLSVWDEEVSVLAGKLKQNHAYLGTGRAQTLSLGVNRKSYLEIDTDGVVAIKNLRLDRHRISFAAQVPGYSGTRGDIVFNSDPNDEQPFAWVCLGAFRWQPLKAAR